MYPIVGREEGDTGVRHHPAVTAIQGDAASPEDVARLLEGVDVVVSCVGNPDKHTLIMEAVANNVLDAAGQRPEPPRCIFISSIGLGGTSWLIGKVLERIGGRPNWADYQAADLRIRSEQRVPVALVRPYALTSKPGKGTYKATTRTPITFAKPIARADVARFLLDATTDPQWDGPRGIQITGA
jgi:uncharacterized protein YbjT (DUF2867 family)